MTTEATEPTRTAGTGGVLLVGSVPLRQRRRGVPAGGVRARRPARPDPGRRDRAPVRLDRVAVPGAQLAARVRGVPARAPTRTARLPRAARQRRRVGRHAALRAARLRAGGADARTASSPGASATALIPSQCRFQVSLPTPLAPIAAFVAPEDQARIEPLYEAAMLHELATIFDAIPHDQLAVQWDTNFEFAMLDGVMPTWFDDPRSSIVERLVRLGRSVPRRRAARLPLLPRPRAPPHASGRSTRSRSSTSRTR